MGFCNCFMFCCALLYVHSSFAIILMGKRELDALLSLSSQCLVTVVWLFLTVSWGCLQFVTIVFPDNTHLLFLLSYILENEFVFVCCCFMLHVPATFFSHLESALLLASDKTRFNCDASLTMI